MINKSHSYQILKKAVTIFLLLGILLPSVMQAKQLVDFCMMDMNHHEMMTGSHDCCIAEQSNHDAAHKGHENCERAKICACTVDIDLADNQFRVPTAKSSSVILSQSGFNFMVTSPDEFIYKEYLATIGESHPPLYLQYDTFLN